MSGEATTGKTIKPPVDARDPLSSALRAILGPLVREAVIEALAEHRSGERVRPDLLTIHDLCAALQVSRATLHRLRTEGLPELRLGDSPRYRLADVLVWAERQSRK